MPIPLPQLDDRTYNDLVEEAIALMPSLYPEWTDRNPTDPGITLIELFAWLTEMQLYQCDRIGNGQREAFLRLLNGSSWHLPSSDSLSPQERKATIAEATRTTISQLRQRYRAVTGEDFEYLATQSWNQTESAPILGTVKRANCVPLQNLTPNDAAAKQTRRPGHVSVVVIPDQPEAAQPQPDANLLDALWAYLDERRLLTTRHHVVGPEYVGLNIAATLGQTQGSRLVLGWDANHQTVVGDRESIAARLANFFHPLRGGFNGLGWPFGRGAYRSEIYELLAGIPGVDYVRNVEISLVSANSEREQRDRQNHITGLTLYPYEFFAIANLNINIDNL
jgi:hypothetical protein